MPKIRAFWRNNSERLQKPIATSFVDFALRRQLRDEPDLWKGNSPYIYYKRFPLELPEAMAHRPVALYPGFSCCVVWLPSGELGLVIDMLHLFADKRSLAQRTSDWRDFVGRQFLYKFGDKWYMIPLQGMEEHLPIEEAFFTDKKTNAKVNVYDYTMDRFRGKLTDELKRLRRDDPTITYKYAHEKGEHYAAASLAFLRYRTDDDEVRTLQRETILRPHIRLGLYRSVIEQFLDNKVAINDVKLHVTSEPLHVPYKVFSIPKLKFGNGKILERPAITNDGIRQHWRTRKKWLADRSIGILARDSVVHSQYLLAPLSYDDDETDAFKAEIKKQVDVYLPVPYDPQLVIWDDGEINTIPELRAELLKKKELMMQAGSACALVVLPPHISRGRAGTLRRHIKRIMYPEVHTKCILASEFLERRPPPDCEDQDRLSDYQSYLRQTALDLLVTSRYRLWAIAEPLHYDLYIGIDVLNTTAGFTFVACGGEIFGFFPFTSTSNQKERLDTNEVAHIIYEKLKELIPQIREKLGRLPRHIVVHRDGRWFEEESKGLHLAVERLFHEGYLLADVLVGVVEINKTTAQRWRLFGKEQNKVYNPMMGGYCTFSNDTGLLCMTGQPGNLPGTAKPLLIKIAEGTLELEKVLQDAYWLSALAWTKPDSAQATPITIKLADNWLEPVAAKLEDGGAIFMPLREKKGKPLTQVNPTDRLPRRNTS